MKLLFSLKMRLLEPLINSKRKKRKGTLTLTTVFLFLAFSTLSLSMIGLSRIYLKLSAFKKNSFLLCCASENGIKMSFDEFVSLLSQASSPIPLTPEETDELKEDTLDNGALMVEKLLDIEVPLSHSETWKKMSWHTSTHFYPKKINEKENFFQAAYRTVILSEGKMENFVQKKESHLEAELGILGGHIPLSQIPFLLDKKLEAEEKGNFREKNQIELLPMERNPVPPKISFSEGDLLPEEAYPQISQALKIRIFSPQDLSASRLRAALGLEKSDQPVPEGVYLIQDDLGLGGIYIQGDLEEMVLAIEDDFQVISFLSVKGLWVLKFSPTKGTTIFLTPEKTCTYDLVPRGIIIANGKIHSLGGGLIDSSGQAHLVKYMEIPSVLQGVHLTIISSDEIILSSHLIHQGVKWMDGVPYVNNSRSQLTIFATGRDFCDNTPQEGKIIIDKDSPPEIKIHASIAASGKGFSIEGKEKTVHILGSLQTSDYASYHNALKIRFDQRLWEEDNLHENGPLTVIPVLFPSSFKISEWREF